MAACPVCGLDESAIALPDTVVALRSFPRRWRGVISRFRDHDGDTIITTRPEPGVWSALEYAEHVRDGLRLFDAGLADVLVRESPSYPPIEPPPVDPSAQSGGADPARIDAVLDELAAAAVVLADRATHVATADWRRPFTIGGEAHPAAWIVQHATHEGAHHLRDIDAGLTRLAGHGHPE